MRFSSFDEMLNFHCKRSPDSPALIYEKGGEKIFLSFAALRALVEKRAEELRQSGVSREGIVCVTSVETIAEIFACAKAGVSVAMLSENVTEEQVSAVEPDALFCDEETYGELRGGLSDEKKGEKGEFLFFTSGTTAKNKAVILTERSLCSSAFNGASLLPLETEDVLMCMLPLDHVFGFVCGLLWGLSCGAAVALGRGPAHYSDDCRFFSPTALSAVPLMADFLLRRGLLNPELRLTLIGAGDCPRNVVDALSARGIRVSCGYGLTETSSGVALSLGSDASAMTVCPDDKITLAPDGEIIIDAPTCVMKGYYRDEEATASALKDGLLYTGDIGRFDEDGLLHIVGRKKEIIILRNGTKIFLPEYESALAAALPGVDFAVAESGGYPALIARADDSDEIKAAIEPVMRGLSAESRIVRIICVSQPLPRTAAGKVKRAELKGRFI